MIEIKNRFSGAVICSEETIKEAVSKNLADLSSADLRFADLRSANLSSANLRFANLSSANLRSANLSSANLSSANLRFANLSSADLRSANLSSADLRSADLRSANLSSADLRFANLRFADLRSANLSVGMKLAWQSHDLLAEILKRAAGDDVAKVKVAGYVLICREQCWSGFLEMRDPLAGWAMGVLAEWIQEGDDAPGELIEFKQSLVE